MGSLTNRVIRRVDRTLSFASWEVRIACRRFLAQHGWWGFFLLAALVLAPAIYVVERSQAAAAQQVQLRAEQRERAPTVLPRKQLTHNRTLMEQFDAVLLHHDDLPTQVQDLLNLAEREHLIATKGDYRAQVDSAGQFLRYRISLPVKGEARAVHRFIDSALSKQPALGLESVQFQRQSAGSSELDARIQWVMLARLPSGIESQVGVRETRQ